MIGICATKNGRLIEILGGGYDAKDHELSSARLSTIKQNALNAGYSEDEITVKWITDKEWAEIQAAEQLRNYDPLVALRAKRNDLLQESDWTQLADSPMPPEKREEWRIYRQALRDLPETAEDKKNPVWPLPPA
jgi:hypothetical protein